MASALQWLIDDGEPLLPTHEIYLGNPEQRTQLVVRDLHRTRRGRGTGRWLRERGRHGGMEGDMAFNFLHHLMDVAVEHGDRAEPLQKFDGARAIVGAPAPLLIDGPQWNVGEHHDRRLRGFSLEIVRKPLKLLFAEIAEPARLKVHDVDETDEMYAVGIKAVPPGALGVPAVVVVIELHPLIEEIVLARHVVHVEPGLGDDAIGVVELGW